MPHIMVISLKQVFALLMSGLLLWGIVIVNSLNSCLIGDTYFCLVDSMLPVLMSVSALSLFGFTIVLFQAYTD
ncbi:MAG: hypothetical protein JKX94_10865 [Sneathiella sp.]|nr:hypothetical protein [Sneathiella sp.]